MVVRLAQGPGINNAATCGNPTERTMTKFSTKTIRQAGMMLAIAISFSAISTQSFAFSAEAQQMCTSDAFRLCGSEIPNVSKITACMLKQRTSLSPGCRTVMEHDLAANKVAAK